MLINYLKQYDNKSCLFYSIILEVFVSLKISQKFNFTFSCTSSKTHTQPSIVRQWLYITSSNTWIGKWYGNHPYFFWTTIHLRFVEWIMFSPSLHWICCILNMGKIYLQVVMVVSMCGQVVGHVWASLAVQKWRDGL